MQRLLRLVAATGCGVLALTATTLTLPGATADASMTTTAPAWTLMSGPTPAIPANGLSDLSCPSTKFCMAVGPWEASVSNAQDQEWNGASWSAVAQPDASTAVQLSISCVSRSFCMAVGGQDFSDPASPLAEVWNGSVWTEVVIPAGMTGVLEAVSCVGPTNCEAVGETDQQGAIALRWHANSWSVVPIANEGQTSPLYGIDCVTKTFCVAVGWTVPSGANFYDPLIEEWDGSAWSIVPGPDVEGELFSVSCSTESSCEAVGDNYGPTVTSLIESWNGTTWQATPSPGGGSGQVLSGVDCYSQTVCLAVGTAESLNSQDVVLKWKSNAWTVATAPDVSGGSLGAISCIDGKDCVTLGETNSAFFAEQSIPYSP